MFRRIGFFILLNAVVIITLTAIMAALGVGNYLTPYGLDYRSLAIFCAVWGMGGAFISLAMSRFMAKMMMRVQVIPENVTNSHARQLLETVRQLSQSAGIPMPEVGIYESPDINAFATGPTKKRSLVAVSSGLMNRMNDNEVKGVLAHEVAHIANGDMVTMTLLQGVVNAFVMFLARIVAFAIQNAMRSNDDREGGGMGGLAYWMTVMVLEMVFMFFGSMVIATFSRHREYRADAGGARLAGSANMIAALEALKQNLRIPEQAQQQVSQQQAAFNAMKIEGGRGSGLAKLFASHPPLTERISRLREHRI